MSAAVESENETMQRCASCGIAGGDGIILKICTACHLVRYCSVKCQKDHWPKHKKACRKRAAELRDELLFKQPESNYLGDCPICCLPQSIDKRKSMLYSCCSKVICNGCSYTDDEGRHQFTCPFCREAKPRTEEKANEQTMKRIEANDPVAMCQMGTAKYHEGDYNSSFEYLTRAAALGDADAHYQLSCLYGEGKSVEIDAKRALHHAEKAAIGGHPIARYNLGCTEAANDRMDRAAKHWIIAAKLGDNDSLEAVKNLYKSGHVSKEDFTAALRGYQTAIIATKSPQRDAAAEFYNNR